MSPRAVVVGGGLAGLAAALDLSEAGVEVLLLEKRRQVGGATWSLRRGGLEIDNGQHVHLRCCTEYRDFMRRIGAEPLLRMQRRLEVPVIAPGPRVAWIRRALLPAPLHLLPSLVRFSHLPVPDRIRAAAAVARIGRLDVEDPRTDQTAFGAWLARHRLSGGAGDDFWDLLLRPTLNLPAHRASLALAAKVFQTGLLASADGADIGWTVVPFERAHAIPARQALERRGARVRTGVPVASLRLDRTGCWRVEAGGEEVRAEVAVLAVPHAAAACLLPPGSGVDPEGLRRLGTSAIVNLHLVFDRRVTRFELAAGWRSPVQWIFDRSSAAGLREGQYLTVSLSAADELLGLDSKALCRRFVPALAQLFPRARDARLIEFHVVREPAATFEQRPGTRRLRPGPRTALPGLYLAGAWTDTGWPATMESAVRSGRAAARAALADLAAETVRARAA